VPAARQRSDQNLDSLLDTMANVVGILVVLVAVTQLTVGDAVERIRDRAVARRHVDPADLAPAESEATGVTEALAEAQEAWQRLTARPAPVDGMLIDEAGELLDSLAALPGAHPAPPERLAAERAAIGDLEAKLSADRAELDQLRELLAQIAPEQTLDQPKLVRLPDPRPPRPASEMIAFFCRYGRVHAVDLPALERVLDAGVRAAVGAPPGEMVFEISELPWIENHFAKEIIGREGFRWIFRSGRNGFPTALLEWREVPPGDSLGEIRGGTSRHAAVLAAQDPARRYAYYFVWSDSYEVYLAARDEAEQRHFEVGWEPLEESGDLIGYWHRRGPDTFQTD